jgi:Lhr-like helicase
VIFRSGIFSVDSTNLKQAMREAIIRYKNRLGKLVERQVEEEVEGMATRFKQREEELKRIPADEGELVRMRFYLNNDCQDFLGEANLHYELCQDFYQLFEDYCIELNFAQYEKATEAIIQQYKFLGVINAKLTQLASLEQQMIEAINNERDAILKGLEDMAPQIGLISNYSSLAQISECYVSTSRTYHDLENFQKQLDGINYR